MKKPFSIGIVCYPSLGGSGVIASEIASGLARRGHKVHVLSTARPARLDDAPGLRFHHVAVPPYPLFEHAPYVLALATKIADVARAEHLDVVHLHYGVPHATSGWLAKQLLGASAPKFVVSLHGTDVTRVGLEHAYRELTCAAITASDGVTVPSEFLRREAIERLGVPESKAIEVIPNFVDADHFTVPAVRDLEPFVGPFGAAIEGPILFHVSNFREVKRVGDLVEVLARVRRHLPGARLVVVGDGPERPKAEARAEALGVEDAVVFLGRRPEFASLLRHADAFVLPSETESFGVAALEALSCGVPVVGYRVGGLPELVTEDVGRLVAPFDVDALAQATLAVVSDRSLRAAMGAAARARVIARFRREPALDRYEAYFERICGW